jgi:hypothetical protein
VSTSDFYELQEPTSWVEPPATYSFSTLQALSACPRRWQLVHSAWGAYARFPERPQPAAIEGQIVHEALDLLARELGRNGRPPIGSPGFREALDRCGFWTFFFTQVEDWNRRLASHPRTGPAYVLRTQPRELANQAIRLFRERYRPGAEGQVDAPTAGETGAGSGGSASLLTLLQARGVLSEVRVEHPKLPLVGVLDVVAMERDGSTTVVDFKTGGRKPAHEEQVLLYALLWWRATGNRPSKAVLQYLDTTWASCPEEAMMVVAENAIASEIYQAREALTVRPAASRPGRECTSCPVRPRCDDGWAWSERASQMDGGAKFIDIEVAVASSPTQTGFLGKRSNGEDVSVVFDAAVGRGLPPAKTGDRFRIVDAAPRSGGTEVALLPWTEMYHL